jgi:hypothetical protein
MSDQAQGRVIEAEYLSQSKTPPQYLPKVDAPPMGYFEDFYDFVATTWRPVLLGALCAATVIAWLLLGYSPAP